MKFNQTLKNEIKKEDYSYCYKQWEKFTALNEKERVNLEEILMLNKMYKNALALKGKYSKHIYDATAKTVYTSRSNCARMLGVSVAWVTRCIKEGYKAKGHILVGVNCGR